MASDSPFVMQMITGMSSQSSRYIPRDEIWHRIIRSRDWHHFRSLFTLAPNCNDERSSVMKLRLSLWERSACDKAAGDGAPVVCMLAFHGHQKKILQSSPLRLRKVIDVHWKRHLYEKRRNRMAMMM